MESLSIAEANLNRNYENEAQLGIFLETAEDVRKAIKSKYGGEEFKA